MKPRLLLLMAAILTSTIDSAGAMSRYFLPYQLAHIGHQDRMGLTEKSVRVGFTWADAFRNVRKRLLHKKRDYLFATKDQASAFEYIETCKQFCEIFNVTKSILTHGVDAMRVPVFKDGADTGVTEEVKIGFIKFDTGSRIIAFSSNPNAMRVFGGDVGLDEYAFHPAADLLWETAQGRITWGFDLDMWSAHNGIDTQFNAFARDAEAGKNGFVHHKITMEFAASQGLVEKINEVSGRSMTREEFLADCRKRAGSDDVYEQAYNCQPRGSTAAIVSWSAIQLCQADYKIPRLHLERAQIVARFGEFRPELQAARQRQIGEFLDSVYGDFFRTPAHHALGFDVAASGKGDLAAISVDAKTGDLFTLRALFTCRTEDWDFLKSVLWHFLRRTPSVQAAGDETGLGRQICWETAKQFPGQFTGVNFASLKHDMGFALMNQLATTLKRFPVGEKDIGADYFALQKTWASGKWRFSEGRNAYNPNSHCDLAWSGALASHAATLAPEPRAPLAIPRARNRDERAVSA